jgi:hypothetical protein
VLLNLLDLQISSALAFDYLRAFWKGSKARKICSSAGDANCERQLRGKGSIHISFHFISFHFISFHFIINEILQGIVGLEVQSLGE